MRPISPRFLVLSLLCLVGGAAVGRLSAVDAENQKIRKLEIALAVAAAESAMHRRQAELCDLVLLNCQANYVRVIRGLEAVETSCGGAQ